MELMEGLGKIVKCFSFISHICMEKQIIFLKNSECYCIVPENESLHSIGRLEFCPQNSSLTSAVL